jgi:hypothetical protein
LVQDVQPPPALSASPGGDLGARFPTERCENESLGGYRTTIERKMRSYLQTCSTNYTKSDLCHMFYIQWSRMVDPLIAHDARSHTSCPHDISSELPPPNFSFLQRFVYLAASKSYLTRSVVDVTVVGSRHHTKTCQPLLASTNRRKFVKATTVLDGRATLGWILECSCLFDTE